MNHLKKKEMPALKKHQKIISKNKKNIKKDYSGL